MQAVEAAALLNAVGQDVTAVAAHTHLLEEMLAPFNTIHAILKTASGRSGSFNIPFGTELKSTFEIEVVTTNGAVTVTRNMVKVARRITSGKQEVEQIEVVFSAGVKAEVLAFAASIKTGVPDPRASPLEALADIRVMQSMLESGEEDGVVKFIGG
ncbi:hypothetical protein BDV06DRAFT_227261 [Aspergillus oleicola]